MDEATLRRDQRAFINLTTFSVYPFPSKLVEIPYPIDSNGIYIPPSELFMYSRSHAFPMPRCYHGVEGCLITIHNMHDGRRDTVHLLCGYHGGKNQCPYHIDISALLRINHLLLNGRYPYIGASLAVSPCMSPETSYSDRAGPGEDMDRESDASPMNHLLKDDGGSVADDKYCDGDCVIVDEPQVLDVHRPSHLGVPRRALSVDLATPRTGRAHKSYVRTGSADSDVPSRPAAPAHYEDVEPFSLLLDPERDDSSDESDSDGSMPDLCSLSSERLHTSYCHDAYPLPSRRDGISPIVSCLNPITHEFSNELFLSRIVEEIDHIKEFMEGNGIRAI